MMLFFVFLQTVFDKLFSYVGLVYCYHFINAVRVKLEHFSNVNMHLQKVNPQTRKLF